MKFSFGYVIIVLTYIFEKQQYLYRFPPSYGYLLDFVVMLCIFIILVWYSANNSNTNGNKKVLSCLSQDSR